MQNKSLNTFSLLLGLCFIFLINSNTVHATSDLDKIRENYNLVEISKDEIPEGVVPVNLDNEEEVKKQKELAKEYELKINDLKNEFKELEQSFDRISKERNKLYAEYTKLTRENTSLNSQNKRLEGIIDVKKNLIIKKYLTN